MDKQELAYLLKNYFQDSLEPDEERRLVEALTENPSEELLEYFDIYYRKYATAVPFSPAQKQKIWNSIAKNQPSTKTGLVWKKYMKYVAVLVSVVVGAVLYTSKFSKDSSTSSSHTVEIAPIYLKTYAEPLLSIMDRNGSAKRLTHNEWKRYGVAMDDDNSLQISGVPTWNCN